MTKLQYKIKRTITLLSLFVQTVLILAFGYLLTLFIHILYKVIVCG
jgi:hypothetical protein